MLTTIFASLQNRGKYDRVYMARQVRGKGPVKRQVLAKRVVFWPTGPVWQRVKGIWVDMGNSCMGLC